MCFVSNGELSVDGKTPPYVFREYSTNRRFRIYSGPGPFNNPQRGFNAIVAPELPSNVRRALWQGASSTWPNIVIGSFEICPLVPDKENSERPQPACIESAGRLIVKRFE